MSGSGRRTLAPEEAALWERVIATVKPLPRAVPAPPKPLEPTKAPTKVATKSKVVAVPPAPPPPKASRPKPVAARPPQPGAQTLDGSWDRQLSRGAVVPDSSIDLHGHSLRSAYDRLDQGLDAAIRRGDRVLLLVTGKPPRAESERPHARGAIRSAVGDWLAASRHASRIAAVRTAHPRHGGQGALYIIMRRPRATPARNS